MFLGENAVPAMQIPCGTSVQVAPKRAALAAAQDSLNKTLAELASAQAQLVSVQTKITTLEAQFEEATAKKSSLAAQVNKPQLST